MSQQRECVRCERPLPSFHWWQWPGPPPMCREDMEECRRLFLDRVGAELKDLGDWPDEYRPSYD